MPMQRKLGKPADQRKALLRNQVTQLIWNGKIVTTEARAKEVRSIAEKYGSVLDISYDKNRFTVMTALKLLPEKESPISSL